MLLARSCNRAMPGSAGVECGIVDYQERPTSTRCVIPLATGALVEALDSTSAGALPIRWRARMNGRCEAAPKVDPLLGKDNALV